MKISIVIPAQDAAQYLPALLQKIEMQTLLPREVVIIDSSGDTRTQAMLSVWPGKVPLVYRRVDFAYPGHARNLGVALTSSPWIAFLDCRTVPKDNWLADCAAIASSTGARFVGGLLECSADTFFKRCLLAATYGEGQVRSLPGSLVSKALFNSTGGFLSEVRAGEDMEWMRRLAGLGVTMATAGAPVVRYEGFPATLASAVHKWHRNNIAAARIDVCESQKMLYITLFMMLLFLLVFRWNMLFANWKPWSPYYIPNITKIFVSVVLGGYLIYRGLIRPIRNSVSCTFLLPWSWLAVCFVGLCLDLAKAPGMILGASILIRKRLGTARPFQGSEGGERGAAGSGDAKGD